MSIYEDREAIKIATLYYMEDLTQAEIARRMNISRSLVSKILVNARKKGLINFSINSDSFYSVELEVKLEKEFGLQSATIIDTTDLSEEEVIALIGQLGAKTIFRNIEDLKLKKIGISWGMSIKQIIDRFPVIDMPELEFIPLIGGMSSSFTSVHSNELCNVMAKKTGGTAHNLYAPALVESENIKEDLLRNDSISEVLNMGRNVDMAIVGIASLSTESTMKKIGYLSEEDYKNLNDLKVIGDINSRFFDKQGNEVKSTYNNNIIGVNLEELKKIEHVIGIAYQNFKLDSMFTALENKLVTHLITTDQIANDMLNKKSSSNR